MSFEAGKWYKKRSSNALGAILAIKPQEEGLHYLFYCPNHSNGHDDYYVHECMKGHMWWILKHAHVEYDEIEPPLEVQ